MAFADHLWFRDTVIAVIYTKFTADFFIFPEVTISAVLWLVRGINSPTQSRNLQSFRFTHDFGHKKRAFTHPRAKGRINALCNPTYLIVAPPVIILSLFLPQTGSEPAKSMLFSIPFDCSYYDTIILMYRTFTDSEFFRRLSHCCIILYNKHCDFHGSFFNIIFQKKPLHTSFYNICRGENLYSS